MLNAARFVENEYGENYGIVEMLLEWGTLEEYKLEEVSMQLSHYCNWD